MATKPPTRYNMIETVRNRGDLLDNDGQRSSCRPKLDETRTNLDHCQVTTSERWAMGLVKTG